MSSDYLFGIVVVLNIARVSMAIRVVEIIRCIWHPGVGLNTGVERRATSGSRALRVAPGHVINDGVHVDPREHVHITECIVILY